MNFKGLFCLACLILLGGHWSESAAQMGMGGSPRMTMQGTCLAENVPCNQRAEWQYAQQGGGCEQLAATAPLTAAEQQSLAFMREEEKLARDLYQAFYQQWGTPVFATIAMAEQQHMDAVLCLLQLYGVTDTTPAAAGVFTSPELQARYDSLLARGTASQADALFSGAFVEEADILDLQESLALTANDAVVTVYTRLLAASEQHLRAFVNNIEQLGLVYAAQLLPAGQLTEILNGDNRHGGVAFNRAGQMQGTRAHFTGILSTDTGQYGNNLRVTQQERLHIAMQVSPDPGHLGQMADFVNIASYTPPGSGEAWMFTRTAQGGWLPWSGDPAGLAPAQARQQLMAQNRLAIHDGELPIPGTFRIQAGYRLQDGSLVLCGAPLEFTVE